MLVCSTLIYIEVIEQAASERTFGEHTLNGMTDYSVSTTFALAQLSWSVETLSARITSITCVYLFGFFLAGEYHLVGVDDDYVVATIYVWSECWLVLSAEQLCY